MSPKVSVIVPIYNTAQYLDNCITSILSQTFPEFEIICIDDASPDDSYEILRKIIENDKRVSLIRHKTNKGLGGARNSGIKKARGEYILCVDSDDTIKKNMLEYLYSASEEGYYDVICCGFDEVNERGAKLHSHSFSNIEYKDAKNVDVFTVVNTSFCNKLWRRELLTKNHLLFPENLYFEDVSTTPRVLLNASSIKVIDKSLYNYYKREGTITTTFTEKHITDLFKAYDIVSVYLESRDLKNRYLKSFHDFVDNSLRFHAQSVDGSDMTESEITHYLTKLLVSKVEFLGINTSIVNLNKKDLLFHIGSLRVDNFDGFSERKNNSGGQLNLLQRLACRLIAVMYKPFISQSHYKKLKSYPEYFFKDSNSLFTRSIAAILQLK